MLASLLSRHNRRHGIRLGLSGQEFQPILSEIKQAYSHAQMNVGFLTQSRANHKTIHRMEIGPKGQLENVWGFESEVKVNYAVASE